MSNYPLVSIIMPVFNSAKYIQESINSIISQTYSNWELLIVDDLSTDDSWRIISEFKNVDLRIKIFRNPINLGSGYSRNFAIEKACGSYIAFLDSDDIWLSNKLTTQISFMEENRVHFSFTSFGFIDDKSLPIRNVQHPNRVPLTYAKLLRNTDIGCLTAVYNCEILGKHFMSLHRRKQDYALWLSILKCGVLAYPILVELAKYRVTSDSATAKKWTLVFEHIKFLKETQNFSYIKAVFYTTLWLKSGIIKYSKYWFNTIKF
jgi:teichuronic acid biosynthesis glycosyltransferase TuaG